MKVIDPGHHYALDLLDYGDEAVTSLRFVKRMGEAYPGTNMQEVIRALIDRTKYLDAQVTCWENGQVLINLRDCLRLLEERAASRHGKRADRRLYEKNGGTNDAIEHLPTCLKCRHIGCAGECRGPA